MAKARNNTAKPKATTQPKAPKASKVEPTVPATQKHIVTEEDLVNNPALAEQGVKVGDEIEIPVVDPAAITTPIVGLKTENGGDPAKTKPESIKPEKKEKTDEEKEAAKLHEIMKPYVKSNPTCKKFIRTSDGQVFFGEFAQAAKDHQKTIDDKKQVQVYDVK